MTSQIFIFIRASWAVHASDDITTMTRSILYKIGNTQTVFTTVGLSAQPSFYNLGINQNTNDFLIGPKHWTYICVFTAKMALLEFFHRDLLMQ